METDKKRQHYVWKKYLKPWTVEGKIWCKRGESVFNPSLENIAQEKFFYYAEPLNEIEYSIILSIIKRTHPSAFDTLLNDLNIYRAASENDEYSRKNSIENYHDLIEHSIGNSLDCLYQRDRSFLEDEKMKAYFCYFVGLQQMRTKKSMQASTAMLRSIPAPTAIEGKYDVEKMEKVFSLVFADLTGNWIHSKAKFVFLECGGDVQFITSDQPVFNVHKGKDGGTEPPKEMELLYPIAPELALFITEKDEDDWHMQKSEVVELNQRIYSESYEQIFTKELKTLKEFDVKGAPVAKKGG